MSAESDSKKAGFFNRMGWGSRPALLLVDVCKAYWTAGSPLDTSLNPESAASPDSMRRLLAAARQANIPVVWTQVFYESPAMKDAGLFWHKSKACNVWQKDDQRGFNECVEGLLPDENAGEIIIKKKYPSAFFGTTLFTDLHVLNIDTLVICGVSTSGCVRASTLDAMCYGFRPMVVKEACGDRSPEIQNANLFDLDAKYADVVSEQEALEKMGKGWS